MRIEHGTARADVPHQYEADIDPNEADMGAGQGGEHECLVCRKLAGAQVHTRWQQVSTASRESASTGLPRVHG